MPGDYVVGDEDGVVVIPASDVEPTIRAAEAKRRSEIDTLTSIGRGNGEPHASDLP